MANEQRCKFCNCKIAEGHDYVRYEYHTWVGHGRLYAGECEAASEVVRDAGVFCSPTCLLSYLKGVTVGGDDKD